MNLKTKILIAMINLYNGGAEKSLINLLKEIDYSKYEIDLLLFQKEGLFLSQVPAEVNILKTPIELHLLYNKPKLKELLKFKNIKLIFSRYFLNFLIKLRYINYTQAARSQIRWNKFYKNKIKNLENKYDIALSYLNNDSMRYVIDKTNATKKYIWVHNNYKKRGCLKELDIDYYSKANRIITISDECLRILEDVFPNIKDKFICIPNISSKKFIISLANKKPKYKYEIEKFKILSIGRFDFIKGIDLAVEAAKILKENKVSFQWYIIGDGIMKKQLDKKIRQYKLDNYLYLIGTTDNPYSYISASDILVQPSRSEGKSMVLDEAKILNKPFVVTKYPTVYDQANDDISLIVDINAESIANGIIELYNDRNKIKFMEDNLKKISYSNENEIEKYYKLFDE